MLKKICLFSLKIKNKEFDAGQNECLETFVVLDVDQ